MRLRKLGAVAKAGHSYRLRRGWQGPEPGGICPEAHGPGRRVAEPRQSPADSIPGFRPRRTRARPGNDGLTPVPARCGRSAVPPAGPGSRSGRSRRWCLRPDGCRRHGRGPVRRRWQGQGRCRRAAPRSGMPRTDGRGPSAGTPGPVSETSMIATEPSRRPVMRICSVAASLRGRLSSACAALRTRLSRTRNSWSGSASMVSPRSIALIQAIDASDGEARGFAHLGDDRLDQRSCGGRARPPARGHRTASTGRTRWRAPASASVSARSAAPADRARWRADRTAVARTPAGCADRG